MNHKKLQLGKNPLPVPSSEIKGGYVMNEGENFYKISHCDRMDPFFMTVVSSSDHWMFISSNGALTAGRVNASNALFPYYTDDKIHDSQEITGSKSIFHITRGGEIFLWEPFSLRGEGSYTIQRNLYKNVFGNKLIFEEINESLGLCFRYGWFNSDRFGFVKKSTLENLTGEPVFIELIDGLQNLLPSGINLGMQTDKSTLLDAYKKSELLTPASIAAYTLSSIPVDRPEPSEALRATLVWSTGINPAGRLLSSRQLNAFRQGLEIVAETDIRAGRGAYFVNAQLKIEKNTSQTWYIIAEVNQDASDLARLEQFILSEKNIPALLEDDIRKGTEALVAIVAASDGLQLSEDPLSCSRHFSNTLFNVMRGGIPHDPYLVGKADLLSFLEVHHPGISQQHARLFASLPEKVAHTELHRLSLESGDPVLQRLCFEYLPLTFSRRHGDPSRPWNMFAINIKKKDGTKILDYQGNWRDIFQNWDALSLPFPGYIENYITKFVNASTADGYNPYRLTRNGIEWEEHDPHDPWSFIGYWGDHQVIYLLRFLEHAQNHHPGMLDQLLGRDIFVYANVPYRIASYSTIVKNPHDTIHYDHELADEIKSRVKQHGADGKLVWLQDGRILHVNLTEKILVSLLTKLSNFIPEAGIWLNTQRPEWNDANNALVGNGASMVTVYYLRRFFRFFQQMLQHSTQQEILLSTEVAGFLDQLSAALNKHSNMLSKPVSDTDRRLVCDDLGTVGEQYRSTIYTFGFSGERKNSTKEQLLKLCELALVWIDHSIRRNRREDGLYHAYNLVSFRNGKEIRIRHLYEMLEGQVALLSAGFLDPAGSLQVLDALRASKIYTADRKSYLLYPDRQLKKFDEKNLVPSDVLKRSMLFSKLEKEKNESLIQKDVKGNYHFHPSFRNGSLLREALETLKKQGYEDLVEKDTDLILDAYEQVFDHQSFTGRSGAFYGYEGLNSIYWHMVSKLQLAVKEIIFQLPADAPLTLSKNLVDHYYEIRAGIGVTKSPAEYGAFPTDPYSHTPGYGGARQPGLTGQVKEDVISRFGELGVEVMEGKICFDGRLLHAIEFLSKPHSFSFYDVKGNLQTLEIPAGSLAFTYCQVPVIYTGTGEKNLTIHFSDGKKTSRKGFSLEREESSSIFARQDWIRKIEAGL
jgi:hypothetical protein